MGVVQELYSNEVGHVVIITSRVTLRVSKRGVFCLVMPLYDPMEFLVFF